MPKTTFVRKPCTLSDAREEAFRIECRHGGLPRDSYYVAEELQLPGNSFFELCNDLLSDRDWVAAFSNRLYPIKDGAVPALRVTCAHSLTVLIIDPQGFSYPRYVGIGEATK